MEFDRVVDSAFPVFHFEFVAGERYSGTVDFPNFLEGLNVMADTHVARDGFGGLIGGDSRKNVVCGEENVVENHADLTGAVSGNVIRHE